MTATGDANYPKRLENIYDAPVCLYYKGKLPDNKKPAVAIVGSRSCSEYGRQIAHTLGKELAMAGVEIISGLAMGIDASGHSGAIYGGGSTYAVMGCGVDICYPAANRKLYQEILLNGGILSEYPWQTPPSPGQFPVRNRIISGLSDIVIVVEARKKSGSLITADQALEQNREVMAVPGRIFDKTSEGCNRLIKMGAAIISTPQDVLEMLELTCPETVSSGNAKKFCLAPDEEMVYSNLDFTPKGLEEILMQCEKEPSELMEVLMRLIIKGMVRETSRNYYVKV
jgi:DNA processing protein